MALTKTAEYQQKQEQTSKESDLVQELQQIITDQKSKISALESKNSKAVQKINELNSIISDKDKIISEQKELNSQQQSDSSNTIENNEKLLDLNKAAPITQLQEAQKKITALQGDLKKEKNKPPKIETRIVTEYEPKCSSCVKEEHEKAITVMNNKQTLYESCIVGGGLYAIVMTVFQIINADGFLFFCKKLGKEIGEFYIRAWDYLCAIECSSAAGTITVQALFGLVIVAITFAVIAGIVALYVGPEWMRHWGTVAELVMTLGIVINWDRQLWELWHHNLLLVWLYSQIIYFVGAFIIWKKFIDY